MLLHTLIFLAFQIVTKQLQPWCCQFLILHLMVKQWIVMNLVWIFEILFFFLRAWPYEVLEDTRVFLEKNLSPRSREVTHKDKTERLINIRSARKLDVLILGLILTGSAWILWSNSFSHPFLICHTSGPFHFCTISFPQDSFC